MHKRTIWDVIFWIAFVILILYIIAKITGIINTPEWINLLPIITIAFMIGSFYQKVTSFMNLMNRRTIYLKEHVDFVERNVKEHEKRFSEFENRKEKARK